MPKGIYNHQRHSKETCVKIRNALSGKKRTDEIKSKMKENCSRGESHYKWKGDKANDNVIHRYIEKIKPKSNVCEECGEKRKLMLASLTNHNYTRNPNDYKWLCYSCHKKMDMKCSVCGKKDIKLHLVCENCINWKREFIRLLKEDIINSENVTLHGELNEIINKRAGEKLCQ